MKKILLIFISTISFLNIPHAVLSKANISEEDLGHYVLNSSEELLLNIEGQEFEVHKFNRKKILNVDTFIFQGHVAEELFTFLHKLYSNSQNHRIFTPLFMSGLAVEGRGITCHKDKKYRYTCAFVVHESSRTRSYPLPRSRNRAGVTGG